MSDHTPALRRLVVDLGGIDLPAVRSGVYLLWDADDAILYIGESGNMLHRVGEHIAGRSGKNQIEGIARIALVPCENEIDRRALESFLIAFYRPPLNEKLPVPAGVPFSGRALHLAVPPDEPSDEPPPSLSIEDLARLPRSAETDLASRAALDAWLAASYAARRLTFQVRDLTEFRAQVGKSRSWIYDELARRTALGELRRGDGMWTIAEEAG